MDLKADGDGLSNSSRLQSRISKRHLASFTLVIKAFILTFTINRVH